MHARAHAQKITNNAQVISPRIRAYLHMWGGGRLTEEGERIPVQVTEMKLSDIQSDLLLPEVVHHTIDERSPLFGHTQASLQAAGAEVVVVFTGSTELGSFQARQSYLPTEIFWGHTFAAIISPAPPGTTRHVVDLSRFHDVEPQPGYESELATPQVRARAASKAAAP